MLLHTDGHNDLHTDAKFVATNHNQVFLAQGTDIEEVEKEARAYTSATGNPYMLYAVQGGHLDLYTPETTWSAADIRESEKQGWILAYNTNSQSGIEYEIQRVDCLENGKPAFISDIEACQYVLDTAKDNPTAQKAIAILKQYDDAGHVVLHPDESVRLGEELYEVTIQYHDMPDDSMDVTFYAWDEELEDDDNVFFYGVDKFSLYCALKRGDKEALDFGDFKVCAIDGLEIQD